MIIYAKGDITKFNVDAIVNAANGFGLAHNLISDKVTFYIVDFS